jgi:hypothetical protein
MLNPELPFVIERIPYAVYATPWTLNYQLGLPERGIWVVDYARLRLKWPPLCRQQVFSWQLEI